MAGDSGVGGGGSAVIIACVYGNERLGSGDCACWNRAALEPCARRAPATHRGDVVKVARKLRDAIYISNRF